MFRFIPLALLLTACGPDETIAGYAEQGTSYALVSIDGTPFAASATLQFGDNGAVTGRGPCNTYNATQTAPYPWFELGRILSTRKACPDLQHEGVYFSALSEMRIAEVAGRVMILSNEAGREMVFQAE